MSSAHSPTFSSLHLRHNSFSNPSVNLSTSQFILQPFRCFTYVTVHPNPSFAYPKSQAHSPTFPPLHLRHNSFSNPSVALPTSQLILQPFRCFSYVTVHFPTLISLLLHHKLILQRFRHFTYVTTHSPTLPSLYLRHSSFSNPSVPSPTSRASFSNSSLASPTSQLILQHLFRFSYVTSSSLNSPAEPRPILYTGLQLIVPKCCPHTRKEMEITGSQVWADDGG